MLLNTYWSSGLLFRGFHDNNRDTNSLSRSWSYPILPVLVCLLVFLSGCASPVSPGSAASRILGEHVAYRVVNASVNNPRVAMPALLADNGSKLLFRTLQARSSHGRPAGNNVPSTGSNAVLPAVLVGTQGLPDDYFKSDPGDDALDLPSTPVAVYAVAERGHRVPGTAWLHWRHPVGIGSELYAGRPAEPQQLNLRRQIPGPVLARVLNQWRYRLNIDVVLTDDEPLVRWKLVKRQPDKVRRLREIDRP